MARDLISRAAVNELLDELCVVDTIYDKINELPTVDAVEVVRCKDCKHFTTGMAIGMCKRDKDKPILPIPHEHFCSFGVKEGEIKPYKGEFRCPECDTYNAEWKKRIKTVKAYFVDIVYCWHCGCKVQITGVRK